MANNGVSICAPEHRVNEIADRREQPERVYDSEKIKSTKTWKLGKGVVHTKVTEDSKRLFFECPYENVTIELKERLNAGKDCGGYSLGTKATKFVCVTEAADHGNIAYRVILNFMSSNISNSGVPLFIARLEAKENYVVLEKTIQHTCQPFIDTKCCFLVSGLA